MKKDMVVEEVVVKKDMYLAMMIHMDMSMMMGMVDADMDMVLDGGCQ